MTELAPPLQLFLADLRADPRFRALMLSIPRTRQADWKTFRGNAKAEAEWAYASGKLDAERAMLVWLLGDDPDSRQSG